MKFTDIYALLQKYVQVYNAILDISIVISLPKKNIKFIANSAFESKHRSVLKCKIRT